jgi:hypothetical protein
MMVQRTDAPRPSKKIQAVMPGIVKGWKCSRCGCTDGPATPSADGSALLCDACSGIRPVATTPFKASTRTRVLLALAITFAIAAGVLSWLSSRNETQRLAQDITADTAEVRALIAADDYAGARALFDRTSGEANAAFPKGAPADVAGQLKASRESLDFWIFQNAGRIDDIEREILTELLRVYPGRADDGKIRVRDLSFNEGHLTVSLFPPPPEAAEGAAPTLPTPGAVPEMYTPDSPGLPTISGAVALTRSMRDTLALQGIFGVFKQVQSVDVTIQPCGEGPTHHACTRLQFESGTQTGGSRVTQSTLDDVRRSLEAGAPDQKK